MPVQSLEQTSHPRQIADRGAADPAGTLTRIAIVLPDLAGGGAQRVMLTIAGGLAEAGFATSMVVVGGAQTLAPDVPAGVNPYIGSAQRVRSGLPWLVNSLRALKPDAVISVMGYLNIALLGMRTILPAHTKLIVREANTVGSTIAALPRWLPSPTLYRLLYPRAAAIVSPTATIAAEIARLAPAAAPRLCVLQNPVHVESLRAWATAPQRRAGEGLRLVAAGRLTHQKGFDRLIELAPRMPASTILDIFGEGSEKAALQARIAALDLGDRVHLNGFTRNLPAHIAGADAFLLPSRWEGLPNVVLESLALGTPAITSDEAEVSELAAACTSGSLTVASVGEPFLAAVAALVAEPARANAVRPSLLPPAYEKAAVIARWQSLIAEVTGR